MKRLVFFGLIGAGFLSAQITARLDSVSWGAQYAVCSDIPLGVTAESTEGGIKEVRYYANGFYLGMSRTAPYAITWASVPKGNYWVWALVRDTNRNEAYTDTVYIRVGNVDPRDRILNGGFDCLKSWPWMINGYEGGSATITAYDDGLFEDNSYLFVDVVRPGTVEWHIQLQQRFPLQAGHTYQISFYAYSDRPKNIAVGFQGDYDPYPSYFFVNLEVGNPDFYGPFLFECQNDDPKVLFKFNVGGNEVDFYVDQVEILDLSASAVPNPRAAGHQPVTCTLYPAYPNPFNPTTTVPFELDRQADVTVVLYDASGRPVKTLFSGALPPGIHEVRWDGRDDSGGQVPSGVYVVHLASEGIGLAQKILLLK